MNESKILIAIPCMDQVAAQFCQSLAMLEKVGHCLVSLSIGSLIYNSRNDLCKTALQNECDFIMWLDSDMVVPPDTIKRLMKDLEDTGADLVSGLYFRRVPPYSPVAFSKMEIVGNKCEWSNFDGPLEGIHEVAGVGFGCVLMKTDMLLAMAQKYSDFFGPMAKVGEDLSFCWRARQLGYKILLDTDLKCGHVGHAVITQEFYDQFALAEQEAKDESQS